jgi:hypothetical protein
VRRILLVIAVVTAASGAASLTNAASTSKSCNRSGSEFRTCLRYRGPGRDQYPTIERRSGSHWVVVVGPLKHGLENSGMWASVYASPDGQMLLAEWGYACDGHVAIFVPPRGGQPRVVTGERDWRKARGDQEPLGWTRDGQARVRIGQHVRLFDPDRRVHPSHRANQGC